MSSPTSFPRQYARTLRFSLGAPRSFAIAPDTSRVAFLRSSSGVDRAQQLWVLDLTVDPPVERLVADPRTLLGSEQEELSADERARRERSREGSGGIVAYATDRAVELAAFALSGRLFTASLTAGGVNELDVVGPVADPRPSPDGSLIAYVASGALRIVGADGDGDRSLVKPDGPDVTWGLAEFIAAEEMSRHRGYWWSPQGDRLLVARVDNAPVERWWIADPAQPDRRPTEVRYPKAGSANADVSLHLVGLDGDREAVEWDRAAFPYLARVHWSDGGVPIMLTQARSQRRQQTSSIDETSVVASVLSTEEDPAWLELFTGVPAWTPNGALVDICDRDNARLLTLDGRAVTDATLHVRSVVGVVDDDVLITASAGSQARTAEIGEVHVYRVGSRRLERVSGEPGVHTAVAAGTVMVLSSTTLHRPGQRSQVLRDGKQVADIRSLQDRPVITARPELLLAGELEIPCAVFLPSGGTPQRSRLPVLMDPYGGPHGQRVTASHDAHLTSQWLADQGFAVIVADGRGTPGRTRAWEKAVLNDLAGIPLDDQVAALHALAEQYPLDLDRVAIRGWSFGGYLAALAVLRRPDVFHAAVVGAPVTDHRLYDTHYEERYLGHPDEQPEVYAANSIVTDAGLSGAVEPHRPMMIIHGLADDNVVAAHTLRLSSALLAAGRPHEVLPLSGVTHMATQEQVAENLLRLQVDFLRRSLGLSR